MATGGRIFNDAVPHFGTFGGTHSALEFTTGAWSIWVKNLNETTAFPFVECLNGSFQGYRYAWERGGFAQSFTLYDSVDWRISNVSSVSDGALSDGNWHHIALVFATGGNVKFYLDGSQVGTTKTAGTILTAGGATKYFGKDDATFLDSEISEVACWNAALSDTDIANLAAGDNPKTVGTALSYWRFNGTGTTVNDEIGDRHITLSHDLSQSSDGPAVDEPPSAPSGSPYNYYAQLM